MGVFCLISGLLSLAAHYLSAGSFQAAAQLSTGQWLALLLVGLGPMGAAFFFWDAAIKRGDPRVIGSLAYLTPLLSTLVLVLIGGQRLTRLYLRSDASDYRRGGGRHLVEPEILNYHSLYTNSAE